MELLTDHEISDIEEREPVEGMDLGGLAIPKDEMIRVWARDVRALIWSLRQEREAREAAEVLADYHRSRADAAERREL